MTKPLSYDSLRRAAEHEAKVIAEQVVKGHIDHLDVSAHLRKTCQALGGYVWCGALHTRAMRAYKSHHAALLERNRA